MATRAARDYGSVRRFGMAHVVGAVVVIGAGVAMVTFELVRDRKADVATAQAWDIKGPPCPALTEAQWTARRLLAPKTFDYDGATLGRWSGDASCSDVKAGGGKGLRTDRICQFANPTVITAVRAMHTAGNAIIFCSGRDAVCRPETEAWLDLFVGVPYEALFMRPEGDGRKDAVVKREIFDQDIRDSWRIVGVFDDRQQVVRMWRALGLTVFQVAEGDF